MKKSSLYAVVLMVAIPIQIFASHSNFIWSGPSNTNKIALTIDDGPKPEYTSAILDILDKHRIKATFFVIGKHAKKYPDLIYRISSSGHELGNHTYTHQRLETLSASVIKEEIESTTRVLTDISKQPIKYFRPPGGKYHAAAKKVIEAQGLTCILWDVNAGDYTHASPFFGVRGERPAREIVHRVVTKMKYGSIILMHIGGKEMQAALPQIIRQLKKKGYQFVTMTELLKE